MAAKKSYEVEIRGDTKVYRAEFGKAIRSNDAFTKSMRGAAQGASVINGPLGGISSRVSAVASIFTSGTVALTGFGVGLAGLTLATVKSLKVFDEYQRGQLKTEALIKATGNAAGLSAQQLADQADQVALNTLASVGGVVEAQNVLQTFKTVQHETFNEAIRLSADMAAVFGGSLRDKAQQLGKALEDPATGLTALKRSGVSFTETERDMIKAMQEAGDMAGAQAEILKKLRDQIGGAGSAEAGGLSGDVDTLGQRWDELLNSWASSTGSSGVAARGIKLISGALKDLKELIDPSVGSLEGELARLEERMASGGRGGRNGRTNLENRIADIKQQLLEVKAAKGDVDAINTLLSSTTASISRLEQEIPGASTDNKRGRNGRRGSEREQLKVELAEQLSIRQQYQDQLAEIERQATTHAETQAEIQRGLDTEAAKAKAEKQKIALDKATKQQAANNALLDRQRGLHDAAYIDRLRAEDNETELENSRYERQRAQMERELALLREKNLVSSELEAAHRTALENAEIAHVQRLEGIKAAQAEQDAARHQQEAEAREQQQAAMVDFGARQLDTIMGFMERAGKENSALYKALFLTQKLFALSSILVDTQKASMAAVAMSPMTAGQPWVGIIQAMGATSMGIVAAETLAGIAHGGMTTIPREGTYLLDGGERVLSPAQNTDFTRFMDQGGAAGGGGEIRIVVNNTNVETDVNVEQVSGIARKVVIEEVSSKSTKTMRALQSQTNVRPKGNY